MKEFHSISELNDILTGRNINDIAVQSLDLTTLEDKMLRSHFQCCLFLGCKMSEHLLNYLQKDNFIFPILDAPFEVYPNKLYTKETLYNNYDFREPAGYDQTYDKLVYDHYIKTGKQANSIRETLTRRLHDHSITDAIEDFLKDFNPKSIVAIMGGHNISRKDASYQQVAEIARELTEKGYLMVSGGGPGAMEATHVGAWMAGRPEDELYQAIELLGSAPLYNDKNWLPTAFEVLEKYPTSKYYSLGIPTWLYGHEPPTPFASHIAKYFANSVREDGLLTIAKGGVIFSPGNAGTIQEIFQDLTQNHYRSFGFASPMVFMNKEYWSYQRPIYPMIELMSLRGDLKNLDLGLYDSKEEVIAHIERFGKMEGENC